ncbi:single-stranded DNA-binding protein [Aerococcaceae bacterium WGS1372]
MNQSTFVGRIVRDIKVNSLSGNGRVVNNVIAINRHYKKSNGERAADFIPFVAWNHHADILEKYTAKGHLIAITGMMQSRSYKDNEDNDVYVIECLVSEITLIQPKDAKHQVQVEYQPVSMETMQVREPSLDEQSIKKAISN